MKEELAAIDELHDHVETILVLEGELQPHYKGVVELFKDLTLHPNARDLVLPDYLFLEDRFHGKHLIGNLVLNEVHFTVSAPAYRLNNLKVTFLNSRAL